MSAKGAVRGGALSRLNLFLALCACGAAAPASAQPAQEEVVVTAQRRSENLQRVPISIQAYNAAALKERGITETADLQFHVPGVMVSGGGQNGQRVWIRGIGPNVVGSGVDGNVASYRDGVYLTRSFSGEVPFLDAERVEVLRGPQGTLYGRNATGGAINLVSRDPSYDTTAELVAAYGTDEDRTFTAIVNGGVVDGKLAARLAVSTRRADNAMKNLSHPDYNGYNDYVQAKAAILFEPSEDLRFVLRGDIIDADQLNYAPLVMTSISPASVYGALNFGLGPIPVPSLPTGKFDYRSNLRSAPYKAHDEWGVSLRADWSLDNVKLTAISAYRDMEMSFFTDSTGNSSTFGNTVGYQDSVWWSQEVQIASNTDGPFEWVVGAFYMNEKSRSINGAPDTSAFYTNLYPLLGFTLVYRDGAVETDAYAVFGQASYRLESGLRLTFGGRYSWEEKAASLITDANGTIFGGLRAGTLTAGSTNWSSFSPKIGLEYFLSDDTMLYASATNGFKSGGYNTAQDQRPFDEEKIWSYEAGVKTTLADGALRFNLSAYYMDYSDLQVQQRFASGSTFVSLITNAASTDIWGAEGAVEWSPTAEVSIGATAAYVHARFDRFLTNLPGDAPGAPQTDLSGRRLANAPQFTATLFASYSVSLGEAGTLSLRGDYRYQSAVYFGPQNRAFERQDGYGLVNARISLLSKDEIWEVALVGENLTDKAYAVDTLSVDGFGIVKTFGRARFFGATIEARF